LPVLYAELEPVETVKLGHTVARTIREDIAWTQQHLGSQETGGWLLGRSRAYVLRATVPGGDSSATSDSITLGTEQLVVVRQKHGDALLGDWHWHPGGDDIPSNTDLRAWAAAARAIGDRWVGLICCPSRTWRPEPEICGWQTVRLANGQMLTERLKVA
jgi:Prokaryotic homologs of the JAB domain